MAVKEVKKIVIVRGKDDLTVVASLNNVVRAVGQDDASAPWHGNKVSLWRIHVKT